jgi:hypothetical protein
LEKVRLLRGQGVIIKLVMLCAAGIMLHTVQLAAALLPTYGVTQLQGTAALGIVGLLVPV